MKPLQVTSHTFDWGSRTYVMGILNVTPDSFSGDGLLAMIESNDPLEPMREQARQFLESKCDILDVGGEWCGWCHALDKYFVAHADLMALRSKSYVWLKVNYSPENKNEKVLSRYPAIKGYPHLFVLGDDGALLHSQDTALLEEGPSYNFDKMKAFLTKWAPENR